VQCSQVYAICVPNSTQPLQQFDCYLAEFKVPSREQRKYAIRRREIIEPLKTQGEMEASICQCVSKFEYEFMGRGPKDIHAHLLDDLLIVRLQGVLTAAEQQLVKILPVDKGRDLLKQVRSHLIEIARPKLEAIVRDITGVNPVSMHHDISTVTGEEVVIFSLESSPNYRELKKR
jgi:uncharacterized protein YbcI